MITRRIEMDQSANLVTHHHPELGYAKVINPLHIDYLRYGKVLGTYNNGDRTIHIDDYEIGVFRPEEVVLITKEQYERTLKQTVNV